MFLSLHVSKVPTPHLVVTDTKEQSCETVVSHKKKTNLENANLLNSNTCTYFLLERIYSNLH